MAHIPVLYKQVIDGLQPKPGCRYIDGTLGAGGHARGILEACAPDGELLGLDVDPTALDIARAELTAFAQRAKVVRASYIAMAKECAALGWSVVHGILLDLGLSSMQVDNPAKGFAFRHDGPLDMRFDPSGQLSADDLVNHAAADELADIIFRYGEERAARRIAQAIVGARPIGGTRQLAQVVSGAVGGKRGDIHPATRTFQALRMAVNNELSVIESVLPIAMALLSSGGRLAVISFHSLEDRLIKNFFRHESRDCICPPEQPICTCGHKAILREVTRKPIVASGEEAAENPRSRSAKLRIAEKL